jgi:hypothetical protein
MEALLIQSSKRLMVKSADMKTTQNNVMKPSTPGGQLFPKLSLVMQLLEKSVQPSLGAHVKLESMLFYLEKFAPLFKLYQIYIFFDIKLQLCE